MNYLFSKFFQLPLTGIFKNCTITYPQSHRKCHILRLYEWDLIVLCKQTSFLMGAIGTLSLKSQYLNCFYSEEFLFVDLAGQLLI